MRAFARSAKSARRASPANELPSWQRCVPMPRVLDETSRRSSRSPSDSHASSSCHGIRRAKRAEQAFDRELLRAMGELGLIALRTLRSVSAASGSPLDVWIDCRGDRLRGLQRRLPSRGGLAHRADHREPRRAVRSRRIGFRGSSPATPRRAGADGATRRLGCGQLGGPGETLRRRVPPARREEFDQHGGPGGRGRVVRANRVPPTAEPAASARSSCRPRPKASPPPASRTSGAASSDGARSSSTTSS